MIRCAASAIVVRPFHDAYQQVLPRIARRPTTMYHYSEMAKSRHYCIDLTTINLITVFLMCVTRPRSLTWCIYKLSRLSIRNIETSVSGYYSTYPSSNVHCSTRIDERIVRFFIAVRSGRAVCNHARFRIATKTVLEQTCQFTVTIVDVAHFVL
jgi:hypothetical protein